VCALGRSRPIVEKRESRPFAKPNPTKSPITEAITPTTRASKTTTRRTWRREAPSVRTVANSRARWATVIESVFAITKAPTNRATPPKASKAFWMKPVKPETFFSSCFACAVASRTWAVTGSSGRISLSTLVVGAPGFDCTRITSSLPSFPSRRCAVGRLKMAIVAPPIELTDESSAMPLMWKVRRPEYASIRIDWPIEKCFLSAVALSIATSSGPTGHLPPTSVSGLKR
jgi:hypothetical protein